MRLLLVPAALSLALLTASDAQAGFIIADFTGLSSPDHVVDFGAGLFPNFTPISTEFPPLTVTHARYFTTGTSNNLVGGFLTNDPIGGPDTLKIHFATPVNDVSFVYHQIGSGASTVFRALLGGVVVGTFTNFSDQVQPNNYFGFTDLELDEVQIDFVLDFNVDTVAFNELHTAKCTFRNGLGINAPDYSCLTLPILGTNWVGQIATDPSTLGSLVFVAPGGPDIGTPLFGGELLIQLAPAPLGLLATPAGTVTAPIPANPAYVGITLATQGVRVQLIGGVPIVQLLNAQDLTLGT